CHVEFDRSFGCRGIRQAKVTRGFEARQGNAGPREVGSLTADALHANLCAASGARGVSGRRQARASCAGQRTPSPGSQRMAWWRTYFDETFFHLHEDLFPEAESRREVGAIIDMLGLPADARILDVPC